MKNNNMQDNEEIAKLIKIVVVVFVLFGIFALITYFVSNKSKERNFNFDVENKIQFKEILVSDILDRNPKDYYVLVTNENEDYNGAIIQYLTNKNETDSNAKVSYYITILDRIFNKTHIGEELDINGNDTKKYKFNDVTLLHIQDGAIKDKYIGTENIIEYLKKDK